jgi:hypothetical protein
MEGEHLMASDTHAVGDGSRSKTYLNLQTLRVIQRYVRSNTRSTGCASNSKRQTSVLIVLSSASICCRSSLAERVARDEAAGLRAELKAPDLGPAPPAALGAEQRH